MWSVASIEEGIEILTGVVAGKADKNGDYPEKSVFGRVQKKLKCYLEQQFRLKKEFGGEESE